MPTAEQMYTRALDAALDTYLTHCTVGSNPLDVVTVRGIIRDHYVNEFRKEYATSEYVESTDPIHQVLAVWMAFASIMAHIKNQHREHQMVSLDEIEAWSKRVCEFNENISTEIFKRLPPVPEHRRDDAVKIVRSHLNGMINELYPNILPFIPKEN